MLSVWQRHICSDKLLFLPMNLDNSIVSGINDYPLTLGYLRALLTL